MEGKKSLTLMVTVALFVFLAQSVLAITGTEAQSSATNAICNILNTLRNLLFLIAGGVAALVITMQGIKWAGSADDPGARKQAKSGIVNAIIGLVIVLLAVWVVLMVFSKGCTLTNP